MFVVRNNFSVSLEVSTRGLIAADDRPKTLFHLIDRRLQVYEIQIFRERGQLKLNIGNRRVAALDGWPTLCLTCHVFGGGITVNLDGKRVEFSENSCLPRGPYFVLIGRPFFGRTRATFLQIVRESCAGSVKLISVDYETSSPQWQFLGEIENKLVSGAAPYHEYSSRPYVGKHPNAAQIARLDGVTDDEIIAIAGDFHLQVFLSALKLLESLLCQALDTLVADVAIVTDSEAYANAHEAWPEGDPPELRPYLYANKLSALDTSTLETIALSIYWGLDQSSRTYHDEDSLFELLEILRTREDPARNLADLLALCVLIRRRQFSMFIRLYAAARERLCLPAGIIRPLTAYVVCFGAARRGIQSDGIHLLREATGLDYEDDLPATFASEIATARIILSTSMLDYHFQRTHHSLRGAHYLTLSTAIDKMPVPNDDNFGAILKYSLGKLAIIHHQHVLASEYLREASRKYMSAQYLSVDALLFAGNLKRAREEMLTLMRVSNRGDMNDPFVARYATVTNWLSGRSKYIKYAASDLDSISCAPVAPLEGLNHYSESTVFLSNLCFCLKLRFRWRASPSEDLHIVQLRGGLEIVLRGDRIHFRLGSDGTLKDALDCELQRTPGNRHEIAVRRSEKQFVITVDSRRYVLDISPTFRLGGSRICVVCESEFHADVAFGLGIANPSFLPKPKRKHIMIYSSWYGHEFTQLFYESLVPSLKRKDGLPGLLDTYRITWRIYTSSEQREAVNARLDELRGLCSEVVVDDSILGSEADDPREYLYLSFVDCVKAAMGDEAIILFAPPDHIFGSGLSPLVDNFTPGSYVVCPHPRVSFERVFESGNHVEFQVLNSSNYEYARKALGPYSHGVVQRGIAPQQFMKSCEQSRWWSASVNGDSAEVSFKEPPPVLLEPSSDIVSAMLEEGCVPPFERVDHDIVEWMWKMGRLKVVESNDTFFWVEYCKDSRNVPTISNDYWPMSAQILAEKKVVWKLSDGSEVLSD